MLPVTHEKTHLCVEYENGKILKEEASIDENLHEESKIKKAFLEPEVAAYPSSISRVLESDLIVIGPGDLYTSIIPLFFLPLLLLIQTMGYIEVYILKIRKSL